MLRIENIFVFETLLVLILLLSLKNFDEMHIWLGRQEQRNKILILKQSEMLLFCKHGVCENNIKILGGAITTKMQGGVVMSLLF
jgi:hypothetical protein